MIINYIHYLLNLFIHSFGLAKIEIVDNNFKNDPQTA